LGRGVGKRGKPRKKLKTSWSTAVERGRNTQFSRISLRKKEKKQSKEHGEARQTGDETKGGGGGGGGGHGGTSRGKKRGGLGPLSKTVKRSVRSPEKKKPYFLDAVRRNQRGQEKKRNLNSRKRDDCRRKQNPKTRRRNASAHPEKKKEFNTVTARLCNNAGRKRGGDKEGSPPE